MRVRFYPKMLCLFPRSQVSADRNRATILDSLFSVSTPKTGPASYTYSSLQSKRSTDHFLPRVCPDEVCSFIAPTLSAVGTTWGPSPSPGTICAPSGPGQPVYRSHHSQRSYHSYGSLLLQASSSRIYGPRVLRPSSSNSATPDTY